MAGNEIRIIVTGSDEFSSHAQNADRSTQSLTGSIIKAQLAVTALTTAFTLLKDHALGVVSAAAGFQDSMVKTAALTDATRAEVVKFNKDIIELSTRVPQSAKELADGLFFVVSAGFKGGEAMNVLEVSAKAASAGLGSTQVVADAVTSALNAYKLTAASAGHITDILTNAVVQGKVAADTLAPALGKVLPIAASMGVSFEQVTASIATMTRIGLGAEQSTTALRDILSQLLSPGKAARDMLDSIGLSTAALTTEIRDKGLLATLQDLMTRTHGNIGMLEAIIPDIRGLTGVLATAGTQSQTYNQILESQGQALGKSEKAFKTAGETFHFQLDLLKNDATAAGIAVGNKLLPFLTDLAKDGQRAFAWMSNLDWDAPVKAIGELVSAIANQLLTLVEQAAGWGADLIATYAHGIASSAANIIPNVMSGVANAIASWIHFTKPEKGVLADVDKWGAEAITQYLHGWTKGDFSVFDQIGTVIRDALAVALQKGELGEGKTGEVNLISRLIGGQAAVAEAITQFHQFGSVAQEVFDRIRAAVGSAGGEVVEFIQRLFELAKTESDIAELDRQLKDLDDQLKAINRSFDNMRRPVDDAIHLTERFWRAQTDGSKAAIDGLNEQLRLINLTHVDQFAALTAAQQAAQLEVDQASLEEARNAPAERRKQILIDINKAQEDATRNQRELNDAITKSTVGMNPIQLREHAQSIMDIRTRGGDITVRQQQLATKLENEGHQTAADRLRIANLEMGVARDRAAIEKQGIDDQITKGTLVEQGLERQRNEQLTPLQKQLDDINESHQMAVRYLDDQKQPLEDAKGLLEEQRQSQQLIVDTIAAEFKARKNINDELKNEQKLLDEIAKTLKGPPFTPPTPPPPPPPPPPLPPGMDHDPKSGGTIDDTGVKSQFDRLKAAAQKHLDDLIDWFQRQSDLKKVAIGAAVAALFSPVSGVIAVIFNRDVRDAVGGALDTIRERVGDFVLFLGSNIEPALRGLGHGIETLFTQVIPFLIQQLASAATDIAGGLRDWANDFANWIDDNDVIARVLAAAGRLGDDLLGWIEDRADDIAEPLLKWALAFVDWVADVWDKLQPKLGELLESAKTWIENDGLPALVEKLGGWAGAFVEWVRPIIDKLNIKLGELMTKITEWISDHGVDISNEVIYKWAPAVLAFVAKAIIDLNIEFAKLTFAIEKWVVTEGVPAVQASFYKLGAQIVKGIWAGIQSQWDGFVRDLQSYADKLPDWMKRRLGISGGSTAASGEPSQNMGGGGGGGDKNQGGFSEQNVIFGVPKPPNVPILVHLDDETIRAMGIEGSKYWNALPNLAALVNGASGGSTAAGIASNLPAPPSVPIPGYNTVAPIPGQPEDPGAGKVTGFMTYLMAGTQAFADQYIALGNKNSEPWLIKQAAEINAAADKQRILLEQILEELRRQGKNPSPDELAAALLRGAQRGF